MASRKKITPKHHKFKPKRHFLLSPLFWLSVLVIILIGAGGYFVFFYPKFQVAHVEVLGNQVVNTDDLNQAIWNQVNAKFSITKFASIPLKNIMLVDSQKINDSLLQKFPNLDQVFVKKRMPDSVVVTVSERVAVAVFCADENQEHCFLIDRKGVLFEKLAEPKPDMIIIENSMVKNPALGQSVVQESTVSAIKKISENLQNNFSITATKATIGNTLIISTNENWKLYLDITGNIDLQITKMNALLKNQIPVEERQKLQYIYLQFKDRAYYK